MIVEVKGELNARLFAEKFVEINRRRLLNGEVNLEDYVETSEAEDPSNPKG
ncbi:hypothetical protein [Bacillus pseudomycoides]|uniref:hypothetical protein n=1 Tax=Bacillus pseudomycoides TaxID=64104 RepID=UPI00159BE815|nr:hypothetical protein [Bacillus pseudomycoides]